MGARELGRAEARLETGGRAGAVTLDTLGNVDAMELAIREATEVDRFGVAEIARPAATPLSAPSSDRSPRRVSRAGSSRQPPRPSGAP